MGYMLRNVLWGGGSTHSFGVIDSFLSFVWCCARSMRYAGVSVKYLNIPVFLFCSVTIVFLVYSVLKGILMVMLLASCFIKFHLVTLTFTLSVW